MTYEPFLKQEETTFGELFPSVKSLTLKGKEHGDFSDVTSIPIEHKSALHYSESNLPGKIRCSNPRCQQGGYELRWIIEGIVGGEKTSYKDTLHCNGHEGTPKGRRRGDSCCNYIELNIDIEYK